MRARYAWLATLPLVLGSCYLFCDEGRPCTAAGECLPGFVCVEERCVTAGAKQIGDECIDTGECVDGAVCGEAYCDDSSAGSCDAPGDCGDEGDELWLCREGSCKCKRVCHQGCDYPSFDKCPSGQLCYYDVDQELGFCQEGSCGEGEDGIQLGNCEGDEICLIFNGKGSGICYPTCTILEQNQSCLGTPSPGVACCQPNQNCEHIVLLWGVPENPDGSLGLCFDSGTIDEGGPCSNDPADDAFCQRGLVCHSNFCRQYCNLQVAGGVPMCPVGYNCIAYPGGELLPYGWCRPQ